MNPDKFDPKELQALLDDMSKGNGSLKDLLEKATDLYVAGPGQKMSDPFVRFQLEVQIEMAVDALVDMIQDPQVQMQIFAASLKTISVTRDEVEAKVKEIIAATYPNGDIELTLDKSEKLISNISREEYLGYAQAAKPVFDAFGYSAFAALLLGGEADITAYAGKYYDMSREERRAFIAKNISLLPTETIIDAVYQTLQKAEPEALQMAVQLLATRITAPDITDIAMCGDAVLKDLNANLKQGKFDLTDRANGARLRDAFVRVATAVRSSLVDAGITPDVDLAAVAADLRNKSAAKMPKMTRRPKGNGPTA